jgi:gliding motility-associated-like protein
MNRLLFTVLLLFFAFTGFARHLKGGFFTYTYLGQTTSTIQYRITLTVYMDCDAIGQQIDPNINFTFYDAATNSFIRNENVKLSSQYDLSKNTDERCISGDQAVCYYKIVVYDLATVTLPLSTTGYTVSYQRCCRIEGINNIDNSGQVGNTYSITIPGTASAQNAEKNSSAQFLINDTIVVCGNSEFKYPFVATDPDGDILQYEFCSAWAGGTANEPAPVTASMPPYPAVPYNGYFGDAPLGTQVTINSSTGLISGVAPALPGEYVVTVCVSEFRGNTLIATTRKELHLRVGNCVPIKASLNPSYISCDGFTLTLQNKATSSEIQNYFWDFGVTSLDADTTNTPIATYTYADTGVYTVKLVVNRGLACTDSTTALAKVFPGFFPDFTVAGSCFNKPIQFTDNTNTQYGVVDSWSWDFGKSNTLADTSHNQNPTYVFNEIGNYDTRLIVTNSKGCVDTISKPVTIIDRPIITLGFKDTLICSGDALQLQASGRGIYSWSPSGSDITNENTATPTVTPTATKKYYVMLDDDGCINHDSVQVRVVDFVTVKARGDTTICATDDVQLNAVSDGLRFQWDQAGTLNNPNIINPIATPVTTTTTYTLTATIGHCVATDQVIVKTVAYPTANAGADTVICYGTTAQLNGSMVGSSFTWSPPVSLTNQNTLSPLANPSGTTSYILTVRDTLGCPKPTTDVVLVTVLPKIRAFAGADTAVVVGQPLHFQATGGVKYLWSPATWLNKTDVPDPIAVYDEGVENITYKVDVFNEANCVDSAFVSVKIFKTIPQVFVPTAFSPNGDAKNDVFRPIAVGISRIEYFRVFNRWGQLVFHTTVNGQGWDGRIGGKEQSTGTFVWLVKGVDYTGKSFFAKGTVTLIK